MQIIQSLQGRLQLDLIRMMLPSVEKDDEVIQVSFDTCPGIIEKYQHLEDCHWSILPLSIVFTAVELSVSVGKCINAKLKDSKGSQDA
ncbi:hypothetical protein KY284_033281 [Solanum tuberosum]|nr:hypothetical protein KY284_033281 [Solanum tuberosum]